MDVNNSLYPELGRCSFAEYFGRMNPLDEKSEQ
jgi:hypothetical protein